MNFYILNVDDSTPVYIDEILTAGEKGKISLDKIHVCDSRGTDYPEEVIVHRMAGEEYFADYLYDITRKGIDTDDRLIPSHNAPHILAKIINTLFERMGLKPKLIDYRKDIGTAYERDLEKGIKAVSLTDERCPDACLEPEVCPNSGKEHSSDIGQLLIEYSRGLGAVFIGFECMPFIGSVATIDVSDIVSEWKEVLKRSSLKGTTRFLIATHSKCHGITALVEVCKDQ